jgi:hypothetical protein
LELEGAETAQRYDNFIHWTVRTQYLPSICVSDILFSDAS